MKKSILVFSLALAAISVAQAQIVYDGFDYTVGSTLAGNSTWSALNSGTAPLIASGNLSVDGLDAPTGNKVSWDAGNIQEAILAYDSQTSGTIFYSFAFQLTSLPTSATYSFALATGNTGYAATVWLRADGEGFNIGLGNRSSGTTPTYDTTTLQLNTTYFVVGAYTFNPGTNDDISSLWLNPSSATFDLAPSTPTLTSTGGTDMTAISQFLLRGAAGSPAGELDELRIGTTWASVTPVPEPGTVAMLSIGLGLVLWRLRSRSRVANS